MKTIKFEIQKDLQSGLVTLKEVNSQSLAYLKGGEVVNDEISWLTTEDSRICTKVVEVSIDGILANLDTICETLELLFDSKSAMNAEKAETIFRAQSYNIQPASASDIIPHFIVVNKGSTQSTQNGSYLYPFKTIQQAINSISANSIHKNIATILIQAAIQSFTEADWIYEENITRPYSLWINFKGALQPAIDTNVPFDISSTNRMISLKGNIVFNGGLNHFENLDLSRANLDLRDTSFTATGCRLGNLTKSTYSPDAWCRIKDCRGSGVITMKNGYLLLDNYINCSDSNAVNVHITGGYGVKIINSSGIDLQTSASSIKPYVEATNTFFKGINVTNASYVALLGGGSVERLSTSQPFYSLGGIRITRGIPYNLTMFSYDPYKSIL